MRKKTPSEDEVYNWWKWRDSNPRPVYPVRQGLHA